MGMNTILVPTDFSATAKNAAQYAIRLGADLGVKKIVLYNAYQSTPVITEPTMPAMPLMDVDMLQDVSRDSMKHFRQSLQEECPAGIELEEKAEFGILSNEINEVCESCSVDLIVMGVTGTSKIEEVLIGSTAISVFKHSKIPVLVVPANGAYTPIKNVALASDLKKVMETTPVQTIKRILDETKARLHVLNVYEGEKKISSDKTYQQELLQSLFKDYKPEFHYASNEKFINGINDFVDNNKIDLIIVIPRRHGIFDSPFKESHSKQLAFHSHVPLMYVREGS